MPSHALPRGPESRARRRAQWRQQFPIFLIFMTGLQVAGLPLAEGSAGRQVLSMFEAALGGALFVVVFVLVLMPVYIRAETLRDTQAVPRPRWQYLVIAAGWMAMASGLVAASLMLGRLHFGPGWLARACTGFAVWCAVFGLGMVGRAACWGRVRDMFWWFRPSWIPDSAVRWPTPPPVPARVRDRRNSPRLPG